MNDYIYTRPYRVTVIRLQIDSSYSAIKPLTLISNLNARLIRSIYQRTTLCYDFILSTFDTQIKLLNLLLKNYNYLSYNPFNPNIQ